MITETVNTTQDPNLQSILHFNTTLENKTDDAQTNTGVKDFDLIIFLTIGKCTQVHKGKITLYSASLVGDTLR